MALDLNEVEASGSHTSEQNLKCKDVTITSGTHTQIILPAADPHVVGALWNSSGTVTVSTG